MRRHADVVRRPGRRRGRRSTDTPRPRTARTATGSSGTTGGPPERAPRPQVVCGRDAARTVPDHEPGGRAHSCAARSDPGQRVRSDGGRCGEHRLAVEASSPRCRLAGELEHGRVGERPAYTVRATATDSAGNTASTTVAVTVDNTPPAAPARSSLRSPVAGEPDAHVAAAAGDDLHGRARRARPARPRTFAGAAVPHWTDPTRCRPGTYTYVVTATDLAGNAAASATVSVVVIPPSATAPRALSAKSPTNAVAPPDLAATGDVRRHELAGLPRRRAVAGDRRRVGRRASTTRPRRRALTPMPCRR